MKFYSTCLLLCLCAIELNNSESNYGPYKLDWTKLETCRGPKQGDCGEFKLENTQNPSDLIFRLDFPKDCPVTGAKVVISSRQQNNVMKKLWNYVLSKPCQHFVLGPIMAESFNLTSNNCKVDKGKYTIHINLREKSTIFLGPNFFYGTYSFKVMSFNKDNNFFCVLSVIDIKKGKYTIHINLREKSTIFLGPNFFYGTYSFKVMSFNKDNNFFCVLSVIDIKKV